MQHLLEVNDLTVKFRLREDELTAVHGVSFSLDKGERLGIVGESGAGKSVTGFAIINLISKPGFIASGSVMFDGKNLPGLPAEQMRRIRGNRISMIFQDPMMTLNPVLTVGTQMVETLKAHRNISDREAEAIAMDKLAKVKIPSPERRLKQYPHEFSGGMRQRIVIAIALLTSPSLIIADEPTTALDVTIQAEIMELLLELCESEQMGLILITHDLAVVSQVTQRIAVMYAGRIVELGEASKLVSAPQHPYTRGLLAALPQNAQRGGRLNQIPGAMPNLTMIPQGCPFNNRCSLCESICMSEAPLLASKNSGCMAACHLLDQPMETTKLLRLQNVVKHFDISGSLLDQLKFEGGKLVRKQSIVQAVNDVSFDIMQGETVSVVGESGCGKSTLARTAVGLYPPNSGEIHYKGKRIDRLNRNQMLPYRAKMQMVFQDPYASLNPRMSVSQTLEEPIRFHNPGISRSEIADRVAHVMKQVGVDPAWRTRYPHEFSGGQRQRISIARALAVGPEFIVADEPIAALDVSIQAQILNLLMELQEEHGLTYMFISHDLSVVEHISNRVAVMYLGSLCELAHTSTLYEKPRHPYTKALLSAIPRLGAKGFRHIKLEGDVPSPINLPTGCVFHGRCPYANERCSAEIPKQHIRPSGALVACHGVEEGRI